jgi:hypothetical protein
VNKVTGRVNVSSFRPQSLDYDSAYQHLRLIGSGEMAPNYYPESEDIVHLPSRLA